MREGTREGGRNGSNARRERGWGIKEEVNSEEGKNQKMVQNCQRKGDI